MHHGPIEKEAKKEKRKKKKGKKKKTLAFRMSLVFCITRKKEFGQN
jgi:hypothetical protein